MTTLTIKRKRFVLVPEKEYRKLLRELSVSAKEDSVLAKQIYESGEDEYIDVETFKKKLKERIKTLRRKKSKQLIRNF